MDTNSSHPMFDSTEFNFTDTQPISNYTQLNFNLTQSISKFTQPVENVTRVIMNHTQHVFNSTQLSFNSTQSYFNSTQSYFNSTLLNFNSSMPPEMDATTMTSSFDMDLRKIEVVNEHVNSSLFNAAANLREIVESSNVWFSFSIVLYIALSFLSGLYSALTTSFFSLDLTRLELCIRQGSSKERIYAYRVIPLLKSPHMLLVTLNIGNVACIVCLPILLNFIVRPVFSILISSFVVLVFNKMLPQVIGDRHGLAIAGIMTWFVYLSMFVFFVVAWPLALLLAVCLPARKERFYQRSELIALMELQMTSPDAAAEKKNLSPDEVLIIKGALDAGSKVAMDAMILIDELSPQIPQMPKYSHLAVYNDRNENTQGRSVDVFAGTPGDRGAILESFDSRGRPLHSVASDTPLYDILDEMNIGCYSIAAVYSNKTGVVVGVLTLQNVLDVILGQSRSSLRRDSKRMTLHKIKMVQSRRQLAIDRRRSLPEHAFKYVNLRLPEHAPLLT